MTGADLSIELVAHYLLGAPNRTQSTKTELRYGRRGSLAVDLKKNTFYDHQAGEGGGVLDLVCREQRFTSHREARDWLHDKGLVEGDNSRNRQADDDTSRKRRFALEIWKASVDADRTEVETYLRGRHIAPPAPPSLCFHSNLKHGRTGLYFPAMVAGVQAPNGEVIAIHRTYLQPGGHGKAQINQPKMALGALDDGAVRLAPAEKVLGLAEGIETSLSAQQLFEIPVWATLSCGRFANVAISADVIELQIFADNGGPGRDAARKAAKHWAAAGKRVVIRRPPDPFSDWNDALPHWNERPVGEWDY